MSPFPRSEVMTHVKYIRGKIVAHSKIRRGLYQGVSDCQGCSCIALSRVLRVGTTCMDAKKQNSNDFILLCSFT